MTAPPIKPEVLWALANGSGRILAVRHGRRELIEFMEEDGSLPWCQLWKSLFGYSIRRVLVQEAPDDSRG